MSDNFKEIYEAISQLVFDKDMFNYMSFEERGDGINTPLISIQLKTYVRNQDRISDIDNLFSIINIINKKATFIDSSLSKKLPENISKGEHYSFILDQAIALGNAYLYDTTKRYAADFIIASSSLIPLFAFCDDYAIAKVDNVSGPYIHGKYRNIPVIISDIDRNTLIFGINNPMSPAVITFATDLGDDLCSNVLNANSHLVKLEIKND